MPRPKRYGGQYNRKRIMTIICGRLASSDKGLDAICKSRKYFPNSSTIKQWILEDSALSARYAHAKQHQADYLVQQLITISDDKDANPQAVRNRIDARKWVASKLHPSKYGDKLDISSTVTVQNDVTSLQTALQLHYILQRLEARRAAAEAGEIIEIPPVIQIGTDKEK